MKTSIASHAAVGCAAAALASGLTYLALTGWPDALSPQAAHAQAPAPAGPRQVELCKTTMSDVIGRVVTIRRTELNPGSFCPAHRHPGSHTFGYILEGT